MRKLMIRKFHALLADVGIKDQRDVLIGSYGSDSLSNLSDNDLSNLIFRLEDMKKSKQDAPKEIKRLRSGIITQLTALGVYDGKQPNWERVNAYLLLPQIAGKLMYELNEAELIALRKKLYAVINRSGASEGDTGYQVSDGGIYGTEN